jgi:hypothetical protein
MDGPGFRVKARALAADHTPVAARIDTSWYTAGTVLALVVPAYLRNKSDLSLMPNRENSNFIGGDHKAV